MKRKMLGVMVLFMVTTMLTGCGDKSNQETMSNVSSTEDQEFVLEEIVENVEVEEVEVETTVYVSEEYLKEVEYNSQKNVY